MARKAFFSAEVTDLFFDRAKVIAAMDKKTHASLSRAGAYLRQTARRLIRTRKRISSPGETASGHTGVYKRGIQFGWRPESRSVVVGPEKVYEKKGDAPHALEFSGPSVNFKGVPIEIHEARPLMGPALAQELEKGTIPAEFRGGLEGG